MPLTRSARSVIAIATAALMLLCQTAFVAQACTVAPAQASAATSAAPPCHAANDQGGDLSHVPDSPSSCESAQSVAETVKIPIYSTADLPLIAVAVYPAAPHSFVSFDSYPPEAVCGSPPLTLLHCRLLN